MSEVKQITLSERSSADSVIFAIRDPEHYEIHPYPFDHTAVYGSIRTGQA